MKKQVRNLVLYIIGAIVCAIIGLKTVSHDWLPVAFYGIFCLMSAAMCAGYAWEEWEDIKAHRANEKRNVELSRR